MSKLVAGVFPSRASAEHAADELMHLGLSRSEISLLMSDQTWGREFVVPTCEFGANTRMSGALGAIATVAAAGALLPAGSSIMASGPIVGGLTGLGARALAGGLTAALVKLGVPELDARFMDREVRRGGILVGIHLGVGASSETEDDRGWSRMDLEEVAGLT